MRKHCYAKFNKEHTHAIGAAGDFIEVGLGPTDGTSVSNFTVHDQHGLLSYDAYGQKTTM